MNIYWYVFDLVLHTKATKSAREGVLQVFSLLLIKEKIDFSLQNVCSNQLVKLITQQEE